ncbi:hypothetical protein F4814DRAFT_22858 [Daldinia grandis]|nr:hypothetical protein F4814DRAFT_22858 [Daldinia grandis]
MGGRDGWRIFSRAPRWVKAAIPSLRLSRVVYSSVNFLFCVGSVGSVGRQVGIVDRLWYVIDKEGRRGIYRIRTGLVTAPRFH